jgi:hypothetical protein
MRLQCWYCHKPVTNEISEEVYFRAIAVCPECTPDSIEGEAHPAGKEKKSACFGQYPYFNSENECVCVELDECIRKSEGTQG